MGSKMMSWWIWGLKLEKLLEFGLDAILGGVVKQLENLVAVLDVDVFGGVEGELLDVVHFVTVHVEEADEVLGEHGGVGRKVFRFEVLAGLETLEVTDEHQQEGKGVETAFVEVQHLFEQQQEGS